MKPRWIRFRKRRKETDPEGVLQAGLLVFSATCGATLLLAASSHERPIRQGGPFHFPPPFRQRWTSLEPFAGAGLR